MFTECYRKTLQEGIRVIVLRGSDTMFADGIDLNQIEVTILLHLKISIYLLKSLLTLA